MNQRFSRWEWTLVVAAFCLGQVIETRTASAQAGLRATLEAMDKDQDGDLEPHEITPLARPYLERVAKARRMSLDRPNGIDKWQEAARIYHAIKNGVAGERVEVRGGETKVKAFGPEEDVELVPEFGIAVMKYRYTQDDLDETERTFSRNDRNRDGFIDRAEAERGRWTHRDPFDEDLNEDGLLSRMELTQRYARRRLLDGASDELVQKARRTGNGIKPAERKEPERSSRSSDWRRGGTKAYLTAVLMGRFDTNKNGRLDEAEPLSLGIPKGRIDVDRDGELTREELQVYFEALQDEAGDPSEILPGWFYELDKNRDEQIVMTEFTDEWTDEKIREFTSYDGNGDGILTTHEILHSKALVGGSYNNKEAQMLPPRKTIISEIDVTDDYIVGDLNIQFSVTHSHTSYLDGYLTAPDGTRVELFAGVGAHDDHFDNTILDDQSGHPITKARPPFRGTFQPHGLVKRQPGLAAFNGKSIKGVWQFVIRGTRSDRFGVLHSWGLIVTPESDLVGGAAPKPMQDGPAAVARMNAEDEQRRQREQEKSQRAAERGSEAQVRERISQAEGWQKGIVERLKRTDISEQERRGLMSKMEQIEKYKEHLRGGGSKDDFRKKDERREEKGKLKLNKKMMKG